MEHKQEQIFINNNKATYNEFLRARDRKKKIENRIDTLETLVFDMQQKITQLENTITKSNGDRV